MTICFFLQLPSCDWRLCNFNLMHCNFCSRFRVYLLLVMRLWLGLLGAWPYPWLPSSSILWSVWIFIVHFHFDEIEMAHCFFSAGFPGWQLVFQLSSTILALGNYAMVVYFLCMEVATLGPTSQLWPHLTV